MFPDPKIAEAHLAFLSSIALEINPNWFQNHVWVVGHVFFRMPTRREYAVEVQIRVQENEYQISIWYPFTETITKFVRLEDPECREKILQILRA